jgi:hypothetical protein
MQTTNDEMIEWLAKVIRKAWFDQTFFTPGDQTRTEIGYHSTPTTPTAQARGVI